MMTKKMTTKKQRQLLRTKFKRINLLYGSIRAGKTWILLIVWAIFVKCFKRDDVYFLMCAKTLTSLDRNCLKLLQDLVGEENFKYSLNTKEAKLFGKTVYLEGFNDLRSETKIRGMTLAGAFMDELTLCPKDFYDMLLGRLSVRGAKLFASTNPDSTGHWVVKEIIENEKIDKFVDKFVIDDNTFLDKNYVKNIKNEYSGIAYKRFILGDFCVAEGLIYQKIADDRDKYIIDTLLCNERYIDINVGVDFGGSGSQHAFVCTARTNLDRYIILKAQSIKAKGTDVDTLVRKFTEFCEYVESKYKTHIDYIYADSAEQTIINQMRNKTNYSICNAIKNKIINRIRATDILINSDKLLFMRNECDDLIEGLCEAVWNEKNKQEDERLDNGTTNIDILDAFEYSWEYFINEILC